MLLICSNDIIYYMFARAIGFRDPQAVQKWVGWADSDYIAARCMLLKEFIVQGAILSNYAIEKYLKAVNLLHVVKLPKSHDLVMLNQLLINNGLNLKIESQYLKLLDKAYELRYPDNLNTGYNISLNDIQLLTELDYTVYEIRKCFMFIHSDKGPMKLTLESHLDNQDESLVLKNHCYGDVSRAELFSVPAKCYEMGVLDANQIIEVHYVAGPIEDDRRFLREALKVSDKVDSYPDIESG
jgi:hypothetical protein